MKNKIIIIAGPTASGKTDLAIKVAKMLDTEIISCDSMQIYKKMNIGTAKATIDEMQGVKHHLIDIVEPNQEYSVSDYQKAAIKIIDKLHSNGKIPVICGGTGLYIDSLLYPLSMGAKDDSIREKLENELKQYGPGYMHDKLKAIDPIEAEKVHENNTKRVIRALEIYEITGQIKSNQEDRKKELLYDTLLICLSPNREELYNKINKRVDIMFEKGLIDEVKKLIYENKYDFSMQSMQAIGYKEFSEYLSNNISEEELKEMIKTNSRHYAKRQITWFKRYDFAKFYENNLDENILINIKKFIEE